MLGKQVCVAELKWSRFHYLGTSRNVSFSYSSFSYWVVLLLLYTVCMCVSVSTLVFAAEVNFNESCWYSKRKQSAAEDQVHCERSQTPSKKRKMASRACGKYISRTWSTQIVRSMQLQQSFIASANAGAYVAAVVVSPACDFLLVLFCCAITFIILAYKFVCRALACWHCPLPLQ